MEHDIRDAVAGMPQFRNRLENERGKNNKMSRGIGEVMEDEADEARIVEAEGKRAKKRKSIEREEEKI